MSAVDQLKKILTYTKLINSINENKFKQYVDEVRKFKRDNKIDETLKDIVKDSKSTDLKSLANKFDLFIPVSGEINQGKIKYSIKPTESSKKSR